MPGADLPDGPTVDVIVESPQWDREPGIEAVLRRAIAEAARSVPDPQARDGELALVLTDDAAIRTLNRDWRGIDRPTNVLSFEPARPDVPENVAPPLGDIVIAFETTAQEAQSDGKPFAEHAAHLAVHGLLHLMGYDHQSELEAGAMEDLERAILARLGIPDPYPDGSQIEPEHHA